MSEIINIPLGGVSNEPSDYIAEDGALSVSINAIKHNGSLRPLMPGTEVDIPLPKGADVVAIHEVGNMKHYILVEEDTAAEAPTAKPMISIFYVPMDGRIKIWWKSNRSEYKGAMMDVAISGIEYAVTYGQITELPASLTSTSDIVVKRIYKEDVIITPWPEISIYEFAIQDAPSDEELEGGKYTLSYITSSSEDSKEIVRLSARVIGVGTNGNVLVVACEGKPLTYIIWRDGKYEYLGNKFAELKAFPYLRSEVATMEWLHNKIGVKNDGVIISESADQANKWGKEVVTNGSNLILYDKEKDGVYNKVFGLINTVHQSLSEKGYFYAPFFVRFALRMYDGSHIMHTPPQLMIAGAAGKPITEVKFSSEEDKYTEVIFHPIFCASKLCADIELTDCEKWKDLISHVDVFVSAPLVDYSDAVNSIKSIGVANLPYATVDRDGETYIKGSSSTMPKYNGLYMKSKRELSNLYRDYLGTYAQKGISVISRVYNSREIYDLGNVTDEKNNTYYILLRKKDNAILGINGSPVTLKDVTGTEEVANYNDQKITLNDCGIDNITDYEYYQGFDNQDNTIRVRRENASTTEVLFVGFYPFLAGVTGGEVKYTIDIQRTDGGNYQETIVDNNAYYLAKSFKIEELKNEEGGIVTYERKGEISIEENILNAIVTRKTLIDNGQMRERSIVDIAPMWYNNRVSMAVDAQELPISTPIIEFCCQKETDAETFQEDIEPRFINEAWVECSIGGQTVYAPLTIGSDTNTNAYADFIRYFYYPHSGATKLILKTTTEGVHTSIKREVLVYRLERHKLMNGAYAFNNFNPIDPISVATYHSEDALSDNEDIKNARKGAREVVYGNMVKVSSVANPFHFSEVNQVTLPSGKISGLSTTAKALSQGQFGAFPLYCFSDNGIWALEVSDEGTYSAKQPVSRAVCTNPDSITQTEGSVLFVTKRGLMSIEGSNVTCISEELHGHNITNALDQLNKVKQMAGLTGMAIPDHVEDWMQKAQFLYDDKRQHLYAFREDDDLAYVYSLTDRAWGMMQSDMAHPLPSYTDALVVTTEDGDGNRKVVNMSENKNCGNTQKSLIVTRPLTMGVADGYKTIEALVARGVLDKDDAKMVIWASNDLKTWAIVATSTTSWYRGKSGTPYKYYRIGLLLDWEDGDSINAISADITPRLNNRLR